MNSPLVFVVVLNWNGWRDTIRCLDAVARLDYPAYHVIAIDNGSSDDSIEQIRAAKPEIELMEEEQNLGFAGGNNTGIRRALDQGAEYVWVVNNDAVVEPDSLRALVETAQSRPRIGVVGPAVWRPPAGGESVEEHAAFVWHGEYRLPAECPPLDGQGQRPLHLVDDVAGSSALFDARMLREDGLFDERFFHYWEDVEICARARNAGWLVAHACRARIWHSVGASLSTASAQAQYYFIRNWLLYSRWSCGRGLFTIFRHAPRMTLGRIFGRRWLRQRRLRIALAGIFGLVDALRGRYGPRSIPRWLG
jgi:GT2 family glycosyltransferase